MLFRMIIKIAFKSLLANKLRSILSVLGIIVGVAAVIAMLAIVSGFHRWAMDRIKSFGANQLVVVPGGLGSGGVISGTQQNLTVADALALADVSHVDAVSPYADGGFQAKYLNHNTNTEVAGVAPTFFTIANYQIEKGNPFTDDDVDRCRARRRPLRRKPPSNSFGDRHDPVGKTLKIQGLNFRVIGLVKNRGGGEGYSENVMFVPYTTAWPAFLRELAARPGFSSRPRTAAISSPSSTISSKPFATATKYSPARQMMSTSTTRQGLSKRSISGVKPPPSSSVRSRHHLLSSSAASAS